MNFPSVLTREEAKAWMPSPWVIRAKGSRIQARWERRLLIVKTDEQAMEVWRQRFLQDVLEEREFWARQRTVRAAKRVERHERKAAVVAQCDLGHASTWSTDDDR
ncbi:farnesyl pyrophosphate synthetase [Hordeum vulgare]|nr:farnesyl pyrophosphate synthetase [Hordeum vulgare]